VIEQPGKVRLKVIRREESEYTLVVHLTPAEEDGCVVPLGHFQVEFRKWKAGEGPHGRVRDERYPETGYDLGAIVLLGPPERS
jgi:hypothetical protein